MGGSTWWTSASNIDLSSGRDPGRAADDRYLISTGYPPGGFISDQADLRVCDVFQICLVPVVRGC